MTMAVLLTALLLGGSMLAQQASSPNKDTAKIQAAPAEQKSAVAQKTEKPGQEGLRVHGHWKIVVKNPDGSVANTVEFENALTSPAQGDQLLAQLLTGTVEMGDWGISFTDVNNSWCNLGVGCLIFETSGQGPLGTSGESQGLPVNYGLKVSYVAGTAPSGANPGSAASIVLQGAATSPIATAIATVGTYAGTCTVSNSATGTANAAACAASVEHNTSFSFGLTTFTNHALTPNIAVAAGQIVQFTVTLTFS